MSLGSFATAQLECWTVAVHIQVSVSLQIRQYGEWLA
jgi:hypothetical protein